MTTNYAEITLDAVANVLRGLPRDRVNTLFPSTITASGKSCRYKYDDGTPSCIAGQVFHAFMTPEDWDELPEGDSADDIAERFGFSREVQYLLAEAQGIADNGEEWGEAVDEAISSWT